MLYHGFAFKEEGSVNFLHETLDYFFIETERQCADVILEVSKHFEAGAKKYGDNNWQLPAFTAILYLSILYLIRFHKLSPH